MIIESAFNFQEQVVNNYDANHDFSDLFERNEMRRLAPFIQNSIGTALRCLNQVGIHKPQAIITGTGKGCISRTENFLNDIIRYKETALNPATFIQSTYNTVNSQIAMKVGFNLYSNTYVNQGITLNNVLEDASMFLNEHPGSIILVGTFEDSTDLIRKLYNEAFQPPNVPAEKRIHFGSGISFFCLSGNKRNNSIRIMSFKCFHNFAEKDYLTQARQYFSQLLHTPGTFYLFGANNADETERYFSTYHRSKWPESDNYSTFKHICGEHDTADAFALFAGYRLLQRNPDAPIKCTQKQYNRCIIVNNFQNYMLHIIELELI